jgi:hypothetical protein
MFQQGRVAAVDIGHGEADATALLQHLRHGKNKDHSFELMHWTCLLGGEPQVLCIAPPWIRDYSGLTRIS